MSQASLPVIDIAPLLQAHDAGQCRQVAGRLGEACRTYGFFYISGHGIDQALQSNLGEASSAFFALPLAEKMRIAMVHGGRAWRGYFPVGGELTSGRPDLKEGLYLGSELGADDPRVQAGWPLHGANLWPGQVPALQHAVLGYMAAASRAAQAVLAGMALSLGLEQDWFRRHYTADPTVLFRIFRYPAQPAAESQWGVGEHTDYGLLTLLLQDEVAGLQVRTREGWLEAPPLPGTLVCNIGDMLDRLTGGLYRSTPHRVLNRSGRERFSFPLFFDPQFSSVVTPLPAGALVDAAQVAADRADRWDGASVLAPFQGTYGDYLLGKVGKVFPQLLGALD
ncbi:isopenicillin N synthase family oxygenase [Pseudoxanthomonas gei]|uniref:2-oxoglutarate-dependent ethylene/succinate-forming enzyme n=1 Tax=Pseudoxanthomonas gei TaxID=1383030 RepID=A0ABX0ADW6_9GAMM|nr:isopenicillin N synthase family oxygenase [Pseudoxanthomonas gei]NDK39621.1 isopenicillin N synthase family oxygenase [Pseudoxanthomonas gei]